MREFFIAQMDCIFFFYGLSFILMAVTVYFFSRTRPAQDFWKWIALFGLVHGISEWLDMLALSLGDSPPLRIVKITFFTASFLCFIEVARLDARKRWGKLFGPWVYAPLLSATLGSGWILGGLTGVLILSRYIFGAIGGVLAVRVIVTSTPRQDKEDKDRILSAFAWLLGCYAVTQCFAPKGTFLPASMINQDVFFSFLGFPVQLLRMLLAAALASLAWGEYSQEMIKRSPKEETTNRSRRDSWFPACLIIILLAGWIMVEVAGRDKAVEERNDRFNVIKVAAAVFSPNAIKALSGMPADFQNEYYQRIQEQFLSIVKDEKNVICAYLIGQRNGKNVFLFDLDQKSVLGEDVHAGDIKLLDQMFSSGGAVTVGPKTNRWGTFVSSLIAIRDPADGKIVAVLGFDYDAKAWSRMIARHRLGPILSLFLFTILYIVFFVIFKREQENRWNAQAMGESLRDERAFTESTLNALGDIFYAFDLKGKFLRWNEALKKISGYSEKELRSMSATDFFAGEDIQRISKAIERIFTEGHAVQEGDFVLKDRRKIPYEFTGFPLKDGLGNTIGFSGIGRDSTERKQTEEALLKAKRDWEDSFNSINDAVTVHDMDFNILHANKAATTMLGLSINEILRNKCFVSYHGKECPPEGCPSCNVLKTGVPISTELFEPHLNKFVEIVAAPRFDADHHIVGVVHIVRDITERKRIEEEKAQLLTIIEESKDFIGVADLQGNLLYHNTAAKKMVGLPEDADLSHMKIRDMHPHWAAKIVEEEGIPTILREGSWRGENALLHRNGSEVPVSQLLLLHRDPSSGKPAFISTIMSDISERKRSEEQLAHLSQQHSLILNSAAEGILGLDRQGNHTFVNPAAAKMLGYEVGELLGRSSHSLWHHSKSDGSPYPREACQVYAAYRDGAAHRVSNEVFWRRDGTSFPVEYMSTPVYEQGRLVGAVVTFTDITERQHLIEVLQKSREHLEAQVQERTAELVRSFQKLQTADEDLRRASRAKSEFLANMSHELRTPLNSIIGFSEVLHDERFGPLNERQKRYTENVMVSGRHLLSLINEVLDLSKVEAGKMTLEASAFPIRICMEEVLQLMESQALAKKMKMVMEVPEDLGEIHADQRKIKQVLSNLLANAIKFTPSGGKIGIRGRRIDNGIEVAVWDTGVGISPENLEKAFGAFERLKSPYTQETEGTGLGLTISRKMIELHGGKIWIESEGVGKGAAVKFTIPSRAVK